MELMEERVEIRNKNELVRILNGISGVNVNGSEGWTNFSHTINAPHSIVVQVHNTRQLRNVLVAIDGFNQGQEKKVTVRAVAGWDDQFRCATFFSCCSPTVREEKYNEAFSWSQASLGDVIIRFSRRFHSVSRVYDYQGVPCVDVSAGVQIGDLNTALEKQKPGYGLGSAPMIRYVTAVGLAATSGHGTGKDQPGFAGFIRSMTIFDHKGVERTINHGDPNFTDISAGHMGLFGIVTSITLEVTNNVLLHEQRHSYQTIGQLLGDGGENLKAALTQNAYFTLLHMPSYLRDDQLSNDHFPWQLRLSNPVGPDNEHATDTHILPETWSELANQELTINSGASLLEIVVDHPNLIPHFMKFGAKTEFGQSADVRHIVGPRSRLAHSLSAFPHAIDDITFVFPVRDDDLSSIQAHLIKIDALLREFAERGEYPLTFMFYLRYLQGTNNGLSFTCHEPGERVLAFDFVSHPDTPGWPAFKLALYHYFSSQNLRLKAHLGKVLPESSLTYRQIYGEPVIEKMIALLREWYGNISRDQLLQIPFLTPFILQNFGLIAQAPRAEVRHVEQPPHKCTEEGDVVKAQKILEDEMQQHALRLYPQNEELRQKWCQACQEFTHKIKQEDPFADFDEGYTIKDLSQKSPKGR